MEKEMLQWGKDVKIALIQKGMTAKKLASVTGFSIATISAVINGRYSNSTIEEIAGKINDVLGTEGMPERVGMPSDEWCQEVKIALIRKKMSTRQLAEKLGITRDRLSLVINGKLMNEEIINGVNEQLGISLVAAPCSDS